MLLLRDGRETLGEAEEAALAITAERAALADGQRILELGCGWGSLTLFMAARYPNASIMAVSNSASQRRYIEDTARARGLSNVRVITCDMNSFLPEGPFDRVVSVEMFEHMSNWEALLARVRGALKPDGRLFIHVFSHGQRRTVSIIPIRRIGSGSTSSPAGSCPVTALSGSSRMSSRWSRNGAGAVPIIR